MRAILPKVGDSIFFVFLDFTSTCGEQPFRACSHGPGTVNSLPRVHMMVCCPGATLPRVNFIAPGQVHRHLITTNLSEFL